MKQLIIACALLAPLLASAQKSKSLTIETKPVIQATVDRAGDLYLVTSEAISKYNAAGKLLNIHTTATPATLFDTGNGVRLLMYYHSKQQYTILNPSLEEVSDSPIDSSFAIEPWLVCSSGNYNILILDAADWSIKKVDTRTQEVLAEFKTDTTAATPAYILMQEYQNFIFLLDKNVGIQVFNSMGLPIKKIAVKGLNTFHFLGEELYYYDKGQLHFLDLFTGEERTESFTTPCQSVILTDQYQFILNQNKVSVVPVK